MLSAPRPSSLLYSRGVPSLGGRPIGRRRGNNPSTLSTVPSPFATVSFKIGRPWTNDTGSCFRAVPANGSTSLHPSSGAVRRRRRRAVRFLSGGRRAYNLKGASFPVEYQALLPYGAKTQVSEYLNPAGGTLCKFYRTNHHAVRFQEPQQSLRARNGSHDGGPPVTTL